MLYTGINRTILECKDLNCYNLSTHISRINRTILECKEAALIDFTGFSGVLIEPYWNVKCLTCTGGRSSDISY